MKLEKMYIRETEDMNNSKWKNEKGITLLVLIITVIVMLILAFVVLNLTIGDNGIIKKTQEAAEKYSEAQNNELTILNNVIGEYDNILNNIGGGSGDDSKALPSIREVRTNATKESITVEVIASNVKTYRYSYKKLGEYNFEVLKEQTGNTYTIPVSEKGTYVVKVEAINDNGTVEKEVEVVVGEIPTAQGNITFSDLVWNNQKASISMSTNTGYDIQYQINSDAEGGWITGTTASDLSLNDKVYARLWDGTNGGESTYVLVTDITPPTVDIAIGQVTTNSIRVTASARDNESGMPTSPVYQFFIKESNGASYPSVADYEGSTANYTFSGLKNNTEYDIKVVTRDLAGNEGQNESMRNRTVEITGEGGGISFGAIQWQSDHTATVAIETSTNYTIQYQKNGTSEGNWITGTTASNLQLNDVLYARLWDGTSGGTRISTVITDTVIPNAAEISFSATSANVGTSITATITQSDSQSGVDIRNCRWVYNTVAGDIGTDASDYTGGSFVTERENLALTATTPGSYYLHVLTIDNAGKARESKAGPITVKRYVTGITLDQDNITLEPGATETITATVTPDNVTEPGLTWESSNPDVVTVVNGVVTGVGTGTATITVTANDGSGVSASCTVTVDGLVDAVVVLGEGNIPTWSSASVFRRSSVPYDANNPDNLAGQYKKLSGTTGAYSVETWVDVNGVQWWYCKAKTVQLPENSSQVFYQLMSTNTVQELYLNEFDTSNVTQFVKLVRDGGYMSAIYSLTYYINGNRTLGKSWTSLKKIYLDECDFSNLKDMQYMFYGSGLEEIDFSVLKDSGSTMRKVVKINHMFSNCENLIKVNFGNMNTQSVTTMEYLFYRSSSLTTVDMGSFNTISCTNFRGMFYGCSSLQNVIVTSKFTNNAATLSTSLKEIFRDVPTTFNKDCLGWTNGTWDANGTFTKN